MALQSPSTFLRSALSLRRGSPLNIQQQRTYIERYAAWTQPRKRKGDMSDIAKSSLLSKASRLVTASSKMAKGDMENLQLQSSIQYARSVDLPKDDIQKAVDQWLDTTFVMQPMRYDAMLKLGKDKQVACVMTALTDDTDRTSTNIQAALSKQRGELLPPMQLDHIFDHAGIILMELYPGVDIDDLFECATDNGAYDVDLGADENDETTVTCDPEDLFDLVRALQKASFLTKAFEHRYIVTNPDYGDVPLNVEEHEHLEEFLSAMEEDEDVLRVFHNGGDENPPNFRIT